MFALALALTGGAAHAQFQRPALAPAPMPPLEVRPDGEWRGLLGAGFTASGGNTRSIGFNLALDAVRATEQSKFSLAGQALYGESQVGQHRSKTADLWRLGGRYDWNWAPRSYVFTSLGFERDGIKQLSLRTSLGTGVGYRLLQGPANSFEVFGGLAYRNDKYRAPGVVLRDEVVQHYRTSELVLGEESAHRLSATTTFQQRLTVFPNLDRRGQYRAVFEALLGVAVTRNVNLTVSLVDRYDSQASAPVKRNDVLFFTGVNLRFGPR